MLIPYIARQLPSQEAAGGLYQRPCAPQVKALVSHRSAMQAAWQALTTLLAGIQQPLGPDHLLAGLWVKQAGKQTMYNRQSRLQSRPTCLQACAPAGVIPTLPTGVRPSRWC